MSSWRSGIKYSIKMLGQNRVDSIKMLGQHRVAGVLKDKITRRS